MTLITPQLAKRFAEVGLQEVEKDPLVIAKFSHPLRNQVYYAVNYFQDCGLLLCFVVDVVTGDAYWEELCVEWLENDRYWGKPMERDFYFKEVRFSRLRF